MASNLCCCIVLSLMLRNSAMLFQEDEDEDLDSIDIKVVPQKTPVPVKTTTAAPDTTIGIEADKSLLRDFLSGEYCIHGVYIKYL